MPGRKIIIALIAGIISGPFVPAVQAVWSVETVDSTGNPGEYCSIALDGSDLPRIAYLKAQTEDLRYASYNGAAWSFETLDATEDCGYFASLALTTDGYARIAYCREPGMAQWDLKVAIESVSGWNYYFIDPLAGPTGDYADLTLDADGYPHMSYLGYDNVEHKRTLNYGLQDVTGFYFGPIEETFEIEEGQTSIALNNAGDPRILAFDGVNKDPRLHYRLGGIWHVENISGNNQGDFSSMDLDSDGNVHVAFNSRSAAELIYGFRGSIGWEIESVDGLMGPGWISLVVDGSDRPHIAYYDGENLKYAYKGPSGWTVETVDSDGDVGLRCSIDLDGVGAPHIAYRDETNEALKYAFKLTPTPTPIPSSTPSPTPIPGEPYYDVILADEYLGPGETFELSVQGGNLTLDPLAVDEYIVLEAAGQFWFYPSWGQDVDMWTGTLDPGFVFDVVILQFPWPTGAGNGAGLKFHGAFLHQGTTNLIAYDVESFGFFE